MLPTPNSKIEFEPLDSCLCGCEFRDHDDTEGWCYGCFDLPSIINCYEFKLDNLKLVEQKAKEKRLV